MNERTEPLRKKSHNSLWTLWLIYSITTLKKHNLTYFNPCK